MNYGEEYLISRKTVLENTKLEEIFKYRGKGFKIIFPNQIAVKYESDKHQLKKSIYGRKRGYAVESSNINNFSHKIFGNNEE